MKARYLDVCARVVDVYTPERLDHYINKTRAEGVTEQSVITQRGAFGGVSGVRSLRP